MPIESSALVLGRESLAMNVVAGFESAVNLVVGREHLTMGVEVGLSSAVQRTGGPVEMEMDVSAIMVSDVVEEGYRYRNLGVHTQLGLVPEVRDSDGRLKWAVDENI